MNPEQELDLLMAQPSPSGSVIQLRVSFSDSPKTYNYAAIEVNRLWYVTGADGLFGRTWVELVDWLKLKGATVTSIQRATEWETLT